MIETRMMLSQIERIVSRVEDIGIDNAIVEYKNNLRNISMPKAKEAIAKAIRTLAFVKELEN